MNPIQLGAVQQQLKGKLPEDVELPDPEALKQYLTLKLSVLVEMVGERRMAMLERLQERRKQKLIWWRRIGFATIALRVMCCLTIFSCLAFFRYFVMEHLSPLLWVPPSRHDFTEFLVFDGFLVMFILCLLSVFCEILLGVAILQQHPTNLAVAFAFSQVFVLLVITAGCFAGGAAKNLEPLTRHLFGSAVYVDRGERRETFYMYQRKHQCCGAMGPDDWYNHKFFEYEDFTVDSSFVVPNTMKWLSSCYHETEETACSIPDTCCLSRQCEGHVSSLRLAQMLQAGKERNQTKIAGLAPIFRSIPGKHLKKGCWQVFRDQCDTLLLVIGIMVFILALLSILMVFLVVAGILYHSAIGFTDHESLVLRPATKTPLVMFFMRLDGLLEKDDETITDFSIIEYLKNLDVDEKFGEAENNEE